MIWFPPLVPPACSTVAPLVSHNGHTCLLRLLHMGGVSGVWPAADAMSQQLVGTLLWWAPPISWLVAIATSVASVSRSTLCCVAGPKTWVGLALGAPVRGVLFLFRCFIGANAIGVCLTLARLCYLGIIVFCRWLLSAVATRSHHDPSPHLGLVEEAFHVAWGQ